MSAQSGFGLLALLAASVVAGASCSLLMDYDEVPEGSGSGGSGGSAVSCTTAADCDDGNDCTAGACEGGFCVQATTAEGEPCQIGQGTGICEAGLCVVQCSGDNYQTVCNDEEPCTEDTCDFTTGTCRNEPIDDQPVPGVNQVPGDCRVVLCVDGATADIIDATDLPNDGNDCTDDLCTAGQPSNPPLPAGTSCGQGKDLVCDDSGTCVGCNGPEDCIGADGACSWRVCVDQECGVTNAPNGTSCNDNVYCNGADSCSNGSCSQHAGNPCDGPDGDGDCSETCRESQNDCNGNDFNGSVCNDGTYCNGNDACSNGNCSQHAGDPCDGPDGDGDCSETCRESQSDCNGNDPNGASCDDNLYCNGDDSCSNGACAQHTGDPCVGPDGDGNCAESCMEGPDACLANDPNGSFCDDGHYCNGPDACSNGICYPSNNDPCPGPDGDSDCTESCREQQDDCNGNDPNGSTCPAGECISGLCTPLR